MSLQEEVQLFDLIEMTKIGTLNTAGFYSLLVRVNPVGMPFMLDDVFVQETAIGYNGGQFYKVGLICERQTESGIDVTMKQESEEEKKVTEQVRLKNHNIARLESLMLKESQRPNKERRLMAKNCVIQSIC